jgi:hypothetical protein
VSDPTPSWPELRDGEFQLTDPSELLWRQVNPIWYNNGVVSDLAFRPSSSDGGLLSTSRESRQSATAAFEHHTLILRLKSVGTWGVSVNEVDQAGARAIDDSRCGEQPMPPGHASIDMRPHERKDARAIRTTLAARATARGCRYRPLAS